MLLAGFLPEWVLSTRNERHDVLERHCCRKSSGSVRVYWAPHDIPTVHSSAPVPSSFCVLIKHVCLCFHGVFLFICISMKCNKAPSDSFAADWGASPVSRCSAFFARRHFRKTHAAWLPSFCLGLCHPLNINELDYESLSCEVCRKAFIRPRE